MNEFYEVKGGRVFVKKYPYLQNNTSDKESQQAFLKSLEWEINQKKYVLITLLDWNENPIKEIQGEAVSGTINKDGNSAMRRTGTLNFTVSGGEVNIEDINYIFSINKKVFVEIGIKNNTEYYSDYPILWFPQGLFVLNKFSCVSSLSSAVNITLNLNDKMSLLNGDSGGIFPSTVILDTLRTQEPDGSYVTKKVPIISIIQELLNHFGNEPLNNIIIEDVPLRAKEVMKWVGSSPLYLIPQEQTIDNINYITYQATIDEPADLTNVLIKSYGDDVGYLNTDFTYPDELIANAGDNIVNILDTIKNTLGNFEYFYDEFGLFHFREIKNYLNKSQSSVLLDRLGTSGSNLIFTGTLSAYEIEISNPTEVYSFDDGINIISINKNPNYTNIKNDYIIHGLRKNTFSGINSDVFYHLAIDKKPQLSEHSNILLYKETDTDYTKAIVPLIVNSNPTNSGLPGIIGLIYYNKQDNTVYSWDGEKWKEHVFVKFSAFVTPTDWRTELYYQGLEAQKNGTQSNRYFAELEAFWPQMYDLENNCFYGVKEKDSKRVQSLCDGNYFLDFIEPTSSIGIFNVNNIGIRTLVDNNDDVNCLFAADIPNLVFLSVDDTNLQEAIAECNANFQPWTQVTRNVYNALALGGFYNPAYEQIKYQLYAHTNYATTINLTIIPNLYLEPNSRISINDESTNTHGNYIIQTITIPLEPTGTSSITCSEFIDRNNNNLHNPQTWQDVLDQGSWGNIKNDSWQTVYEG